MASVSRTVAMLGGILVLALLAGALTEATWALGHRGSIGDDTGLRPTGQPTASPKVPSTPTPTVSPSPTPTPTSTPSGPTAVTNSFVHLRAGKSTSSAILADLDGGTTVQLLSDNDAQWQQVEYNGQVGYIFKTYLSQ